MNVQNHYLVLIRMIPAKSAVMGMFKHLEKGGRTKAGCGEAAEEEPEEEK